MKYVNKERATALIAKKAIVIDMRSPTLFRFTKVKNSINLPLTNLVNKFVAMKKDSKILLIHESKDHSDLKVAYNYALQLGITNINHIDYNTLISE